MNATGATLAPVDIIALSSDEVIITRAEVCNEPCRQTEQSQYY